MAMNTTPKLKGASTGKFDEDWVGTNGAAHGYETGVIAGERNTNSATNSYIVTHEECNYTVIDLSAATPVAVSSGAPAFLYGARVDATMSAHAVTIDDGVAGATTTIATIPAGTIANTTLDFGNGKAGIRMETSLVVTPNAASTGTLVVFWRAI